MGEIQISIRSDKKDILNFLKILKEVLCNEEFDVDKDLILIKKKKIPEKEQYSTPFTLLDLDYDSSDIIDRLKELTINDYSETKIDMDDEEPPLLFVFGKDINKKLIYIKLKIKGEKSKRILCLSFHYAEKAMEFPYA